ncbi:flagellar hook-associated protein FlgK [Chitinivibrio alkaliphilus]|uniref:Flagellar hook-associated protein 1 n=1 Tax=Chitinivibrio alkaliphilus ACht1 TaxID=1313304 RepID=U7D8V5_9BACT|nr:flagellar hook-associated protein FlgK [Chitinivibrio alkaliphilus]ERP39375.1 flagellar hook-associated protein FlgK [Chitinivibrio alkaliphilus ACht1]
MGGFSSLNIGNRALHASQMGLNVTGHNIANADVQGYSRKRLSLGADYRRDTAHGQMGFGVNVISIERVRDTHLDAQIRGQLMEKGNYEAVDSALHTVEGILKEPSDYGIQHYMEKYFDAWDNLANNPDDQAARAMLRTQADTLTSVFQNADKELRELQSGQNAQISAEVNETNKILREIDTLNKEIVSVELAGQNANDSRDRRDQLLKDLAERIDYDVRENESGAISITSGGNILLSPTTVNELEVYEKPGARQGDTTTLSVRVKASRREMNITGGRIKGLMDTRDSYIPEYRDKIDTLAISLTETINEQHRQGYNLNGYTGFDFFNPAVTGASDFAVADTIQSNTDNIAAARGGSIDRAGTNEFSVGELSSGEGWVNLTRDGVTQDATNIVNGSVTVTVSLTGGDEVVLEEGVDYAVDYRSGRIQMLNSGYDGNDKTVDFDYMSGNFPGPGNNENAVRIGQLRDSLTMGEGSRKSMSFGDYYGSFIGELGIDRDEASSNLKTRTVLIQEYEERQDSIAGVSLDEEMSNLIRYQRTYQAAARIITTSRDMLDILLNL